MITNVVKNICQLFTKFLNQLFLSELWARPSGTVTMCEYGLRPYDVYRDVSASLSAGGVDFMCDAFVDPDADGLGQLMKQHDPFDQYTHLHAHQPNHSDTSEESKKEKEKERRKVSDCERLYERLNEAETAVIGDEELLRAIRFGCARSCVNEPTSTSSQHHAIQFENRSNTSDYNVDAVIGANQQYRMLSFDDQFPESEPQLELCWNVDINLPSELQPANVDLRTPSFDLSGTCLQEHKNPISDLNDVHSEPNYADNRSNLKDSFLRTDVVSIIQNMPSSSFKGDNVADKLFCEHCGKYFNTKRKLRRHFAVKHNLHLKNVLKCERCDKEFSKYTALRRHSYTHLAIKPFKCDICFKSFSQKSSRDIHLQSHTGYKQECEICRKRFPTQSRLKFHLKSHKDPEYQCEICPKKFTTQQYLRIHKRSHDTLVQEKRFTCADCNTTFGRKRDWRRHMARLHNTLVRCEQMTNRTRIRRPPVAVRSAAQASKFQFECNICSTKFVEKSSLHRHNLMNHSEKIDVDNYFKCLHCDKRFTVESSLNEHLEKFHSVAQSKDMDYSCSICGSLFYQKTSLKQHMLIHSDFGSHICKTCGLVFSEKPNLLMHQNMHKHDENTKKRGSKSRKNKCETCCELFDDKMELKEHELKVHNIVPRVEEIKPFACEICYKRFTTVSKRNKHLARHTKGADEECDECGKRFVNKDGLRDHAKIHVGCLNYVCDECGAAYALRSSLRTHRATHVPSSASFVCDLCAKSFRSKQALQCHIKVHSGQYKFRCDECGKQFVRKCHYKNHIDTHSNERPFKCPDCPSTYKQAKHLRDHRRKAHRFDHNLPALLDSVLDNAAPRSLLDQYIPSIKPLDQS